VPYADVSKETKLQLRHFGRRFLLSKLIHAGVCGLNISTSFAVRMDAVNSDAAYSRPFLCQPGRLGQVATQETVAGSRP
jgi:hypothetical protein